MDIAVAAPRHVVFDAHQFSPTHAMVVGLSVLAAPAVLAFQVFSGASVSATVLGDAKGPKINGFTYKNKTNNRKRWGHRQHYTRIQITGISR